MGRKKGLKTDPISVQDDDILVLDKPIYMAKWRSKLVPVILLSDDKDGYTVCAAKDQKKSHWIVPKLFHPAKDERK